MSNILLFKNPELKEGTNVTVRRGLKWSLVKIGDELIIRETGSSNDITQAIVTDVKVLCYLDLTEEDIKDEHDPACTTLEGLWEAMVRAYPSFDKRELVTILSFEQV